MAVEVTAGGLVMDEGGNILLVKSHKWRDKYVMVGGHIEEGEKAVEALRREIKEETGLDVYEAEFICVQEFIYGEEFYKPKHFIFLDFLAKVKGVKPKVKVNREAQAYVWVKPEEALNMNIEPYTAKTIRAYLEGKRGWC